MRLSETSKPALSMFCHASRRNIFLTGMMGSGKTTVGREVAHRRRLRFVDTDSQIETKQSQTIETIFDTEGEEHFRELERQLLKNLVTGNNQVIATGGGMLADRENLMLAQANGLVILLQAPISVLAGRLRAGASRPLASGTDPEHKLADLYQARAEIYNLVQAVIDTGEGSVADIASQVVELYDRWCRS